MQYKLAVVAFVASALASPQLSSLSSDDLFSIQTVPNPSSTVVDVSSSLVSVDASSASVSLTSASASLSSVFTSLSLASATSDVPGITFISGTASTGASSGVPVNSGNSSIPYRASTATPSTSGGLGPTTSGGGSGSGSGRTSSSTSTSNTGNGASMPTAAIGMGFAGVVGLVGALAL